ncbi:MAG: DDE-type integrase/transposase/recombinase [Desulfobacterium sp.]|nr:DDE-type integrase/transposase/recombinase [Desulfobacterium sp.]
MIDIKNEMIDLNYVRPFQVREIPLKASSYRGEIVTTKLHLKEEASITSFSYESGLERDLYICLDHDYYCYDLQPKPAEVIWTDKDGKERKTYPNCWAVFITGKQILFQIKPLGKLQELESDDNWQQEINAVNKYCQERGWELKIIDEMYIRTPRFTNIMLLRGAAQQSPKISLVEQIKDVLPSLYRKGIGVGFSDLVKRVKERTDIPESSIQYVLEYLIYYQYLYFYWNQLFTKKTLIFLNFDHELRTEPFYELEPVIQINSFPDAQPVKVNMDLSRLSPDQIQEADKRLEAIRPLLEKPNRTKADVLKRAKEIGKGYVTLYLWMKAFEKEGWWGLVLKYFNQGNKEKRFCDEVEQIIQKEIDFYFKGLSSISACRERIKMECKKIGFPCPSYKAIRTRIRNMPARERLGKQGGFIRHEISQSVMGELPAGMQPLDFIQMDHVLLDIELVDQVYRKPAGRPYLTMAIDTNSRMIYGYFLSFDHPDSLSITRSLLTGILPKEEMLKKFGIDAMYPIHGLPKRVQVDNSMEFRSKHLEQFCRSYSIDLEFRPVRRPDKGGYVERLFGTINGRIRDDCLNGYAPPLKTRPSNYDPAEKAEKGGMTILEFEKWLLTYLVKDYHLNPHEGLGKSPLEHYQSGIIGLDQALGTQPVVPTDLEKLKFDILPISGWHRVNSYGVQWMKNRYNSRDLARIRKKNQGESKKIQFRFDPSDIRQIWVYDSEDHCYYPIPITSGNLAQFVRNNSNMPISLSEVEKINQILKENRVPITPYTTESAFAERREFVEEAAKSTRSARKEKEKKKKQPVILMKPANFNEDEIMKGIEEGEDDFLPPLPEDTVKTHSSSAEKEDDDLLPPLQESFPRMKKREGW